MSSESIPRDSKVASGVTVAGSMSRLLSRTPAMEQTVAAVLTAVQDVHQIGVAISVREKVVAQKIDLDERLFFGHGRELRLLAADDLVLGQLVHQTVEIQLALRVGVLVGVVDDALRGANLLVQHAGLVLAQLADDLGGGDVDRRVHVLLALLDMDDVSLGAQRHLARARRGVGRILLDGQHDFGVQRVDVHDLHGIADFLIGVLAQCISYSHFATGNGNGHAITSYLVANKKAAEKRHSSPRAGVRMRVCTV